MAKKTYVKPNQRAILTALRELGGRATARQIAERAEMSVNGVVQSIQSTSMQAYVRGLDGVGPERNWELVHQSSC